MYNFLPLASPGKVVRSMIKNFNPGQDRDALADREKAQALSVFCRVHKKLRAQVVGSPKVVRSEQPSLEITEAIFTASDKAVGSKGRQDA